MRDLLLVVLLAAPACFAQDLPDPGRRLSDEEQRADPDKRAPQKQPSPFAPSPKPQRNDRACEGARTNYQMSCKGMLSRAERSQACAEAYAIYRQACP